jgi:hypothetical protein
MIDDECGAVGGMRNRSTSRKPALVSFCPPQIPHDLTCARTRATAVGIRRLTAWAMARPTKDKIKNVLIIDWISYWYIHKKSRIGLFLNNVAVFVCVIFRGNSVWTFSENITWRNPENRRYIETHPMIRSAVFFLISLLRGKASKLKTNLVFMRHKTWELIFIFCGVDYGFSAAAAVMMMTMMMTMLITFFLRVQSNAPQKITNKVHKFTNV